MTAALLGCGGAGDGGVGAVDAALALDMSVPDAAVVVPPDAAAVVPDAAVIADAALAPPDAAPPPDTTCNGHTAYCDRPYNLVIQPCTHNAFSSKAYRFVIPTPNQTRTLTEQLDGGVRALMLDTYFWKDDLYLCHGECGPWGNRKLVDGLNEIRAWMDTHPRDIVTFILEAYITEAQTLSALELSGLAAPGGVDDPAFPLYHAAGPPGSPWPTLGDMLAHNQRLVVFTDDAAATASWHLHWPTWGWETPYGDAAFPCTHGRGDPAAHPNQIFVLNHYSLGAAGGDPTVSAANNTFDAIVAHSQRCTMASADDNPAGQVPTFVNVDHFDVPTEGGPTPRPDLIDAVEALNGATPDTP